MSRFVFSTTSSGKQQHFHLMIVIPMKVHHLNLSVLANTADVTGGKPMAVLLQSISGVSAINPLVAFYDIHGGKREVEKE
jgi:hypothetical protein